MPAHARVEKYEMPQMVPKFTSLKITAVRKPKQDRPGWIPSHITENWDTDPFAYQTEEELMPAGGLHGQLLTYIAEVVRVPLKKQGLMLLVDTFLLYRNSSNVKKRVGPDLLLMEDCFPAPPAYDLDIRKPPRCIIETTSPKSHFKDLKANVAFYFGLGVETYFVIDAITPQKKLREPKGQSIQKISPDSGGYFCLPEMNIKIAVQQQRLIFANALTGEVLRDYEQLYDALEIEAQRADAEAQRANVAFDEGLQKGEQNKALEIAHNMLAAGIEPAIVAQTTGFSLDELKHL
jgi:Uma2 family endonuclease